MHKPQDAPLYYPGDELCDMLFQSPSAMRNRDKIYREGPIEIEEEIWSNSPDFLKFKDKFSREAMKWQPDVDAQGRVFGNGLRSDFNGMRHVNGYPMLPATYPLSDNRLLREKEGLANTFTEQWHSTVCDALVELFFEDLEPVRMKMRKGSSSCVPFFDKQMSKRVEAAKFSLSTALDAGDLMLKNKHYEAFTRYQMGGAVFVVYRRQSTDAISFDAKTHQWTFKDRPVADLEYAVSGGTRGTFKPASKEFTDVDFHVPDGFARERNRTAMGGPWAMNAALAPIAQSVRKRIYDLFAYSTHHTTRASIQADLRSWKFTIAADVSNHDWFWPTFLIDSIADKLLSMGFDERWVEIFKTCNLLPRYVTDVGPDLPNVLIGDPTDPKIHGGLTSGNSFTDLFGTIGMILFYFIIQVEHTYPQIIPALKEPRRAKELMQLYLKGKLPIVIKDKSDDALLGWTDNILVHKAEKLMQKMQNGDQISPYMKVTYEHGGAFLGSILYYPKDKTPAGLNLIGNIQSLVTNLFSPEYGVQSAVSDRSKVKRPFPGLAWESTQQVYGSCPLYGDVIELIEKTWYDVYGESFISRRQRFLEKDKALLARYVKEFKQVGLPDLTAIDLEVLNDPTKLEYKFAESDVSMEVLDFLYQGLTVEEIEPYFRSVVKYYG
jgi:hypothetical protein